GVAPVLGQAVDDYDGIAVDVLDPGAGADAARELTRVSQTGRTVDVVGVELVDDQRAAELACGRDPAAQILAGDQAAGRVAGVRQQDRPEPAADDRLAQGLGREPEAV